MELQARITELANFGVTVNYLEGEKLPWQTTHAHPQPESLSFATLGEAEDHWDAVAKKAVYKLLLARGICEAAKTLNARDRRVFQRWAEGKRFLPSRQLYQRNYDIQLPLTWRSEARHLTAEHGSIAGLTLLMILRAHCQMRTESPCFTTTAAADDELRMARRGVHP